LNGDVLFGGDHLGVEAGAKRLKLLRELLPGAREMGFIIYPANPGT
jgi:hypothetical protein